MAQAVNEQAVLAELGRLYLMLRELEQALAQARCPDPKAHEPEGSDTAADQPIRV